MLDQNTTTLPGAAAAPVQQPVLGFSHPDVVAAGIKLLPVVASNVLLLRRLENPVVSGKIEDGKVIFNGTEVMELVFSLVTPPATQRALLAKGRDVYTEEACKLADRFSIGLFAEMQQEAIAHFVKAVVAEEKAEAAS